MFTRRVINSTINTSRAAQFSTKPKVKIPARCLIEGKVRACRAVTKARDITSGLINSDVFSPPIEMSVRFKRDTAFKPFTLSYQTNNNPTDTGLIHWVCMNAFKKLGNPEHWGTREICYDNRGTPLLNYMNNLERVLMLEHKSYDEMTNFWELVLGSSCVRDSIRAQPFLRDHLISSWPPYENERVKSPTEHTICDKGFTGITMDTCKVTLRFMTNNDPIRSKLIEWILNNVYFDMSKGKICETMPSTNILTKASYMPNTPTLDMLNKMATLQLALSGHYDNWTFFTGVEAEIDD